MKAVWYEKQGEAREVLVFGEIDEPFPDRGEVRLKIACSGVNPGDVKKRKDSFGIGMAYPRVIPHSDGAGIVDMVGEGVSSEWLKKRVWCHGAQSYRPFGTAAEFAVVPVEKIAELPDSASFETGATLGIPGLTAHRAVHIAGEIENKTVLVQGGAGAVGACAVQLAHQAGAKVLATCRSEDDFDTAFRAGADKVLLTGNTLTENIKKMAPEGIDHIVEVAFAANIKTNVEVLNQAGSIAAYATNSPEPNIPFWEMVFKNINVFFVGSDDIPADVKTEAAKDINEALKNGWKGSEISEIIPLEKIAEAHELVEKPKKSGRVIVKI
jgi:NADPH2:quinone reductase